MVGVETSEMCVKRDPRMSRATRKKERKKKERKKERKKDHRKLTRICKRKTRVYMRIEPVFSSCAYVC